MPTSSLLIVDLRASYTVITTELARLLKRNTILVLLLLVKEGLDLFESLLNQFLGNTMIAYVEEPRVLCSRFDLGCDGLARSRISIEGAEVDDGHFINGWSAGSPTAHTAGDRSIWCHQLDRCERRDWGCGLNCGGRHDG